jgi:hypothetical protein
MRQTARLLFSTTVLVSLIACGSGGGGDELPDGGPDAAPDDQQVLTVDLDAIRAHGLERLRATYGDDVTLTDPYVAFRDGSGSDFDPKFDFGAIYVIATPPASLGLPELNDRAVKVAYRAWLQGHDDIVLVEQLGDDLAVSMAGSGVASLGATATEGELAALEAEVQAAAPSAQLTILAELDPPFATFTVDPRELGPALTAFRASAIVTQVSLDGEVYSAPFEFDATVELTAGGVVDLVPFMTVTAAQRATHTFSTAPSLPAPFGPGPIDGELAPGAGWQVTASAGGGAACRDRIEAGFPGVTVTAQGDALVVSGAAASFAIASVAMLDCVDGVQPAE